MLPLCLLAFALLLIDYFAYPYGRFDTGRSADHGENGLWIRYTWYFGEHSADDERELAHRLVQRRMRYAYFHVRSILKNGVLKYRYPPEDLRIEDATVHWPAASYPW